MNFQEIRIVIQGARAKVRRNHQISIGAKKWSKSNDYDGEIPSQKLSHFDARTL